MREASLPFPEDTLAPLACRLFCDVPWVWDAGVVVVSLVAGHHRIAFPPHTGRLCFSVMIFICCREQSPWWEQELHSPWAEGKCFTPWYHSPLLPSVPVKAPLSLFPFPTSNHLYPSLSLSAAQPLFPGLWSLQFLCSYLNVWSEELQIRENTQCLSFWVWVTKFWVLSLAQQGATSWAVTLTLCSVPCYTRVTSLNLKI